MKMNLRLLSAATLITLTTFTACKKETSTPVIPDTSDELMMQSEDQANVSSDVDDVTADVNLAIESDANFSGRLANTNAELCDGTAVVDASGDPKTITITYNGSTACNSKRSRTGSIVISMAKNMHWADADAVVTITYNNVKITRASDNKSRVLSGTHTFTNVSGGLLKNLPNQQLIVHRISSDNMSITFDDGTKRTWSVAKERSYTLDANNKIVLKIAGTKSMNGTNGIAEWGINRGGRDFATSIIEPITLKEDCAFRITSGELKHVGLIAITVKFGLNADGIATTCPVTGGSYYYKATWTGPNGDKSIIRAY